MAEAVIDLEDGGGRSDAEEDIDGDEEAVEEEEEVDGEEEGEEDEEEEGEEEAGKGAGSEAAKLAAKRVRALKRQESRKKARLELTWNQTVPKRHAAALKSTKDKSVVAGRTWRHVRPLIAFARGDETTQGKAEAAIFASELKKGYVVCLHCGDSIASVVSRAEAHFFIKADGVRQPRKCALALSVEPRQVRDFTVLAAAAAAASAAPIVVDEAAELKLLAERTAALLIASGAAAAFVDEHFGRPDSVTMRAIMLLGSKGLGLGSDKTVSASAGAVVSRDIEEGHILPKL